MRSPLDIGTWILKVITIGPLTINGISSSKPVNEKSSK
jgi:hypothetical protein